jgi:hypothetical protein
MKYEMIKHLIRIAVLLIVALLLMFLPFLPGRYDSLAVNLSYMIQVFCHSALLFIPLGLLWTLLDLTGKKLKSAFIEKLSLIVAGIVAISIALAAGSRESSLFGITIIVISFYFLVKEYRRVNVSRTSEKGTFNPIALYLVIIPVVLFVARSIFITRAVEYSRRIAIENSESLIQDIETYYQNENKYPVSLQALHSDGDYPPRVIGIRQYFYEPNGDAYNLYFEQLSTKLDMEEIVMFNKLDEHQFAAHAKDILEFTGEELALRRGDRRKVKLPTPHWVYFEFD